MLKIATEPNIKNAYFISSLWNDPIYLDQASFLFINPILVSRVVLCNSRFFFQNNIFFHKILLTRKDQG